MNRVIQVTSTYYNKLKKEIKNCLPTSFEKEDIEKWQHSIIPKIDILLAGNSYEHEITEKILTNLIQNCTAGGQFSFEVSCLLQKFWKEVKAVHFMEKADGDKQMTELELNIKTVLRHVLGTYHDIVGEEDWLPAKSPWDRAALQQKSAYFTSNELDTEEMYKKFLAANLWLAQESQGSNSSGGNKKASAANLCFNCGETDHWANECPYPKKKGNKKKSLTPSVSPAHKEMKRSWRRIPPKNQEQEIKYFSTYLLSYR